MVPIGLEVQIGQMVSMDVKADGRLGLRGSRYSATHAAPKRVPKHQSLPSRRGEERPDRAEHLVRPIAPTDRRGGGVGLLTRPPVTDSVRETEQLSAVARGGALSLVGAVVSAVTNLALTIVVTHGVGRSTAGEFFALTSVFLLAEVLCRLGADVGLIYFLARWRVQNRFADMRLGMIAALRAPVVLAVFVGVGMFVEADWISHRVGASSDGIALIRLLAVTLPIAVVYDLCIAATRGFARMRPTVSIDKIGRPTGQLVLVAVIIAGGWASGITGIGAGWAVPYVASAVAIVLIARKLPWRRPQRDVAGFAPLGYKAVSKEFWTFTGPRAIAAVAQLLLQRMDIVLVAALRGPVDAAIYTAATRFLVVGQFVNQALVAPTQPRLSALLAAHDYVTTRKLYETTTSWLIIFVWPMYLAIAVLAPSYLKVFGSGYKSGLWVVILLCLAMMIGSCVGFVDVLLLMVGQTKWNLITTLTALAVDAGLDIYLIPRIGIVGAAVGWVGAILAANLFPGFLVLRIMGMHPFSRATIMSILLSTACFGVLPLAADLGAGGSQLAALGGVAVGTVIYLAALWKKRQELQLDLATSAITRRRK